MAASKSTVAIVGGGFSGCMVAVHLLLHQPRPLRVVLIDRSGTPGRGVAYRDQSECHLLNVRAGAMSAFPERPEHFLNWLNNVYTPHKPVAAGDYVPRRIYGLYLESLLLAAQQGARRGVSLEVRKDEVLGLRTVEGGVSLALAGGSRLRADFVVLALGNPGPADPELADQKFFASPRYIGHAWSTHALHSIRRDDNLLLIGSGLTTLDWLAALHKQGHRGRIHVLSRRGLLPQLHSPAAAHKLSFNPLELPPHLAPLLRQIRSEVAAAEAGGGDWRSVVDALRPYSQRLWQRLPVAEQRRFLRHLRPYWEIHRHRVAPRVVESVYELLRMCHLQVTAGRLLGFEERDDEVEVSIQPRPGKQRLLLRVQRVVNCTGPESNYRRMNHPLIVSLRERGLIQPDSLGLGLLTDEHGALLDRSGHASERMFTLGPARKGQLWETTAVPEIRVQAQTLALQLLSRVGSDSKAAAKSVAEESQPNA